MFTVLIEAFEEVRLVITSEQALDLIDSFGKLSHELLPVPVLDLQETSQVIRLEEHQSNEAPVQLLIAFDLILELAPLVSI